MKRRRIVCNLITLGLLISAVLLTTTACNPWDELANPEGLQSVGSLGESVVVDTDSIEASTPASGAMVVFVDQLVCSEVVDSESYHFQISTNDRFTDVFLEDEDAATNSLSLDIPDLASGIYFWRARAKKNGIFGQWSSPGIFEVSSGVVAASVIPSDGSSVLNAAPLLDWESVDLATGYKIRYGTDLAALASQTSIDLAESSYQVVSAFAEADVVFWQVRAVGSNEMLGAWSRTFDFTISPLSEILVQAGTFQMGSSAYSDEQPAHMVTLTRNFYINKYEITQVQWNEIMGSNPSAFKGDAQPVEQVSWYDVIDFCNALSVLDGFTPAFSGSGDSLVCDFDASGYRLPTEAEWEFVVKGGNISSGYVYAGSDSVDDVAWHYGNSESMSHVVGSKAANELGIFDMSGNVWEWCWDRFDSNYYSVSPAADPEGPASGSTRVVRGGSWGQGDFYQRTTNRAGRTPSDQQSFFGFRIVRTSP